MIKGDIEPAVHIGHDSRVHGSARYVHVLPKLPTDLGGHSRVRDGNVISDMPGRWRRLTLSGAVAITVLTACGDVSELVTPEFAAELLPYEGGRFSMVLLLPKKVLSPNDFASLLTKTRWDKALGYLYNGTGPSLGGPCKAWYGGPAIQVACDGSLGMPKFKLDCSAELLPQLVAMGMPVSGLSDICAGCFISRVVQKTYLEVDEHGTTAAAATGGSVATALRIPTVVDNPFALAIIDKATDAPLFLGVVGQL
jgi:serine protease inhibitor